jgi:predicted nucleotidyltransferase
MAVNRQANIAVDRESIESFCQRWKVKELSLFGSALREDFTPESDIDVLVELKPGHGLTLYDWLDMIEELKGIFGRKVDLVAKGGLKNPFRRRQILRTAEVVYAA